MLYFCCAGLSEAWIHPQPTLVAGMWESKGGVQSQVLQGTGGVSVVVRGREVWRMRISGLSNMDQGSFVLICVMRP